jgi:hypothetical protein
VAQSVGTEFKPQYHKKNCFWSSSGTIPWSSEVLLVSVQFS